MNPTPSQHPDPNLDAVHGAGLDSAHSAWLQQVAGLVDGRLDAVRADWRTLPEAEVLRAAVFGLLLGLLARHYPYSRDVLSRVAEAHPSYDTFPQTKKLATLEQISSSEDLVAQWLGRLLGADDPSRLRPLCTFGPSA